MLQFFPISAVTGEGVEPLKFAIAALVGENRPTIDPSAAKPSAPAKLKPAYPPPKPNARGRGR